MPSQSPPSGIDEALEITKKTITLLIRRHRWLVLAVLAAGLAFPVWALTSWSWGPFLGWLALVPLYSAFLIGYMAAMARWQQEILRLWAEERLNLDAFCRTATAYPYFPPLTLQGLLDELPLAPGGGPTPVSLPTREAVALTLAVSARCQRDRAVAAMVCYSLGLGAVALTLASWSWQPSLGLLLIPLVWWAMKPVAWVRWRTWRRNLATLPTFDVEGFCKLASSHQAQPPARFLVALLEVHEHRQIRAQVER
jgi:hypothetical protein